MACCCAPSIAAGARRCNPGDLIALRGWCGEEPNQQVDTTGATVRVSSVLFRWCPAVPPTTPRDELRSVVSVRPVVFANTAAPGIKCFPRALPSALAKNWPATATAAHEACGAFGTVRLVLKGASATTPPPYVCKIMLCEDLHTGHGQTLPCLNAQTVREVWAYTACAVHTSTWQVPTEAVCIPLKLWKEPRIFMERQTCTLRSAIMVVAKRCGGVRTPSYAEWAWKVTRVLVDAFHVLWVVDEMVHFDVKADNILISGEDLTQVHLADLGNSVRQENLHLFPRHEHCVTRWMEAPEALLGLPQHHVTGDIWSFGCVLAHLWRGLDMFRSESFVGGFFQCVLMCGRPDATEWPWHLNADVKNIVANAPNVTAQVAAVRQKVLLDRVAGEKGRAVMRFAFANCLQVSPQRRIAAAALRAAFLQQVVRDDATPTVAVTTATPTSRLSILPHSAARLAWLQRSTVAAEVAAMLVKLGVARPGWEGVLVGTAKAAAADQVRENALYESIRTRRVTFLPSAPRNIPSRASVLVRVTEVETVRTQTPCLLRGMLVDHLWNVAWHTCIPWSVVVAAVDLFDAVITRLFQGGWAATRNWMRFQVDTADAVAPTLSPLALGCLLVAGKQCTQDGFSVSELVEAETRLQCCVRTITCMSQRCKRAQQAERLVLLMLPDGAARCTHALRSVVLITELQVAAAQCRHDHLRVATAWSMFWARHVMTHHAELWGDPRKRAATLQSIVAMGRYIVFHVPPKRQLTQSDFLRMVRPWMWCRIGDRRRTVLAPFLEFFPSMASQTQTLSITAFWISNLLTTVMWSDLARIGSPPLQTTTLRQEWAQVNKAVELSQARRTTRRASLGQDEVEVEVANST